MGSTGGVDRVLRIAVRLAAITAATVAVPVQAFDGAGLPVGTTLNDFFMPGTQPDPTGMVIDPFIPVFQECFLCHGGFEAAKLPLDAEPLYNWLGSMMAHSARDPIFWAANTIANQDADFGGDLCLRCHSPAGWVGGRSVPTDGLGLINENIDPNAADFDGVTCHVCHRLVNPTFVPGESPDADQAILDDLAVDDLVPAQPGSGRYVVDPEDRRRGPYDLGAFIFHDWLQSPFHQESILCATCHDVSNPLFTRNGGDGSYDLNALDAEHDTGDKFDMFPIERTFSEWANSAFAAGGVQMNGRFGGAHPTGVMQSCQDCHMPDQVSPGCVIGGFADHPDLAAHFLNGGNTWVIASVLDLYNDGDPPDDPPNSYNDPVFEDTPTFSMRFTQAHVDDGLARTTDFLRAASDMEVMQTGNRINVRVTNMCGHKLPTGYPEGRRMWLNVKFLDISQDIVYEHGAYDFQTADLHTFDTKVYEAKLGIDSQLATDLKVTPGESFHFVLNNTIMKDNRIPPMGFTNAGFAAVQAEPVAYSYSDGQHWDDTAFTIPPGAVEAVVTLYHQTTTKEYVEFLRDENITDSRGQIAYDQWEAHGRSAPIDMDMMTLALDPLLPGDFDNDGLVGIQDFLIVLGNWGPCPGPCPPICAGDADGDCNVGINDFLIVLANWTG